MKILFLHLNFPGQFKHIATSLGMSGQHDVRFLTTSESLQIPGVKKIVMQATDTAPMTQTDKAMVLGSEAFGVLKEESEQGFIPDIMIGHAGFGLTMFAKKLFPKTPLIGYFEWYFTSTKNVFHWDSEAPTSETFLEAARERNALLDHDIAICDFGIIPTEYQRQQFPSEAQSKLVVLHEGVQTSTFAPSNSVPDLKEFIPDFHLDIDSNPLITFVSRGLEPVRGFPEFMRGLEILQKKNPTVQTLIVGFEQSFYSSELEDGQSYKKTLLTELDLDLNRIQFAGAIGMTAYQKVLQRSDVHVYFSRDFVPSWSLLEAMSSGCCVLGSDTPPIWEMIQDKKNGALVDHTLPQAVADSLEILLSNPELRKQYGKQARETITSSYTLETILPEYLRLIFGAATLAKSRP